MTITAPRACSKCNHYDNTDPRGRCIETQYDPGGSLVYCGCKCEFSAAPPESARVEGGQENR